MSEQAFGERIKELRLEQELGLRQAAKRYGISPTYLSRIENRVERRPPTEGVIREMAKVLFTDFDELMRLAGRFTQEVKEFLTKDEEMPVFLRQAREMDISGSDLLQLLQARRDEKDQ